MLATLYWEGGPIRAFTRQGPFAAVPRYVAAMDVAVAPFKAGSGETSPLKLFDFWACGRPAVVADIPTVHEIAEASGAAVLVPSDNPERLAAAIADLLADPERRRVMGERGAAIRRGGVRLVAGGRPYRGVRGRTDGAARGRARAHLPLAAEQYDTVACVEVLEHLYDSDHALREICRVLVPLGRVVVTVPNLGYWRFRLDLLGGRVSAPAVDRRHLHQFDHRLLVESLARAGLTLVGVTGHGVRLGFLARRRPALFSDILFVTGLKGAPAGV